MSKRTFHPHTERQLTRKADGINDARTCELHGTNPASIELVELRHVTMIELESLVSKRVGLAATQFAVRCLETENVYAVNTEGYTYPRYLGRFSTKDAKALVDVDRSGTPKPELEFSGFDTMSDSIRECYLGCEGIAFIAYLADTTEQGVWQMDFVVDDNGFQIHAHSMNGESLSWNIRMASTRIAKEIARAVASELLAEELDVTDALSVEKVTDIVCCYGMDQLF
jgi:hypothetical protein